MNESSLGGGWMFVLIILVLLFGWGGAGFGGGNAATAAYATMADVNSAITNQSIMQGINAVQLSSANNNYETAQLINAQSMNMLTQNNTNLLAAINGFNAVTQGMTTGFNSVNQNIADLGYKMESCCCGLKQLILENRLQDAQIALQNAQGVAIAAEQSQYILSQLGSFQPKSATAAIATASK